MGTSVALRGGAAGTGRADLPSPPTAEVVDLGSRAADGERTRLAFALHDGLTQVVTASVLELDWLARQAEMRPEQAAEALHSAAEALRTALEEIRGVLATLTPLEPADASLPIEDLLRSVVERWQLPVTWSIEGDLSAVPARVLEATASVIREGVANVAKHADSRDVEVCVRATRRAVEVTVEDHGRGFQESDTGSGAGHLGLEMMAHRVDEVHGTLDVESTPGHGTRVVARLPVSEQGDNS